MNLAALYDLINAGLAKAKLVLDALADLYKKVVPGDDKPEDNNKPKE